VITRTEFQALFPEFAATTYNARIDALLPVLTELDEAKAGARLNLAYGLELADLLASQDITIQYGAAGAMSSSSSTTEKKVGDVSVKRSLSSSAGSSSGGGGSRAGQTNYRARYESLLHSFGVGAVAV
jgi:hypothetical protein